jgi:hypothetical protein
VSADLRLTGSPDNRFSTAKRTPQSALPRHLPGTRYSFTDDVRVKRTCSSSKDFMLNDGKASRLAINGVIRHHYFKI